MQRKSNEQATFHGNWLNQTKRCVQDFKETKFYRVIPKGWFTPKDLNWNDNVEHITTEDFCSKFNIEIKK